MWRATSLSHLQRMAGAAASMSNDENESIVSPGSSALAGWNLFDDDNASKMLPFCVNLQQEEYKDYQWFIQEVQQQQHHPDSCPVMIWKILRFIKLIVVRLAHSYVQREAILLVLPLLLGLLVGLLIGRRRTEQHKSQSKKSKMTSLLSNVSLRVFSALNRLMRLLLPSVQLRKESYARDDPQGTENASHERFMAQTSTKLGRELDNVIPFQSSSALEQQSLPKHVAVIMDGNRRYGRAKYQNATRGHRDGANQVLQMAKWCIAEQHVQVLTLYAFSTENWNRDPSEVTAIMNMFMEECENVRVQAQQLNVRAHVVSSNPELIPSNVMQGLERLERDTAHCTGLQLNICVSYGSRSEIVQACRQVVRDVHDGTLQESEISEEAFGRRLLTSHDGCDVTDPDILIRTSGESRISNYLLWQIAYAELFFVPQTWPELRQEDFVGILHSYAKDRQRRYGR